MSVVAPAAAAPPRGWVRYAVAAGVVAAWMAAGWACHLDANSYLLLGVPLLLVFQLLVARRPVLELWFDRPDRVALPWWGWLVAAAFMVLPIHDQMTWENPGLATRLWLVAASCGAVPLALSVARCTRSQWRELAACAGLTGLIALFTLLPGFFLNGHAPKPAADRLLEFARSLTLYLPVVFVLEEVFFRGGLDPYLARADRGPPWPAAFFISALWGWWHLPIVPFGAGNAVARMAVLVIVLPLVHCAVGVPFTFFRRRSGILLVPAAAHAFIDALRNALQ